MGFTYAQIRHPFGPVPTEPLPPSPLPWARRAAAFHRHFCCPQFEPGEPLPAGVPVPDYPQRLDLVLEVLQRAHFWRLWTETSAVYGRSYHAECYDPALPECVARGPDRPVGAVGPTPAWAIFDALMIAARIEPD